MPDAERPDQSAWNINVAAASVRARLVYSLLWPVSSRVMRAGKCVSACAHAIIESKQRLRNWELSIFPCVFFCLPLGSIVQNRATTKIAFFLAWLLLSEWNQHWKFPPLIITATKSLLPSPACMSPHSKGTAGTQEMLPGNKYEGILYSDRLRGK